MALEVQLRDDATLENYLAPVQARPLLHALQGHLQAEGEPVIYICGPRGCGKSHLLQAACHLAGDAALYLPMAEVAHYSPAEVLHGVETLDLVCLDDIEQVLVRGTRFIWEVAFFHKPSSTLVLTDLVENVGGHTEGVGWGLKLWFKFVFRMWNKAKPAPEYQMGWKDQPAAARSLERILRWGFERVVLAHGDLIETNARAIVRDAWRYPLSSARKSRR